jgi:hypothetical protein
MALALIESQVLQGLGSDLLPPALALMLLALVTSLLKANAILTILMTNSLRTNFTKKMKYSLDGFDLRPNFFSRIHVRHITYRLNV